MHILIALFVIFIFSAHDVISDEPVFGEKEKLGKIENNDIKEASGIVVSRKYDGVLWTHNDGKEGKIYAFTREGRHLGEYSIKDDKLEDCEDIAIGPGPKKGKDYIYLGDIGDNNAKRKKIYVYRFIEPQVDVNQDPDNKNIKEYDRISLEYPDSKRDSETLMVDPLTGDILIVSKREENVMVYIARYPQSTDEDNIMEYVATLPFGNQGFEGSGVTAGDISIDSKEILLKDYTNIYYYSRNLTESWQQTFSQEPIKLPYDPEPQGEAIAWDPGNGGYYTLSEEQFNIEAHLYFYPRIKTSVRNKKKSNYYLLWRGEKPFGPNTLPPR